MIKSGPRDMGLFRIMNVSGTTRGNRTFLTHAIVYLAFRLGTAPVNSLGLVMDSTSGALAAWKKCSSTKLAKKSESFFTDDDYAAYLHILAQDNDACGALAGDIKRPRHETRQERIAAKNA